MPIEHDWPDEWYDDEIAIDDTITGRKFTVERQDVVYFRGTKATIDIDRTLENYQNRIRKI